MKLKGKNARRLKPEDRKKKEKTLERMQKVREEDSAHLRDIIKAKLVWAENEKQKGLTIIRTTQIQVHRLEGIIIFIRDLLQPKKEKPKNDNSQN